MRFGLMTRSILERLDFDYHTTRRPKATNLLTKSDDYLEVDVNVVQRSFVIFSSSSAIMSQIFNQDHHEIVYQLNAFSTSLFQVKLTI